MDAKQRFLRHLGSQLFSARTAAGLSQREVGEAAGIAGNTVARIERGEQEPLAWALARICRAIGADPTAVLGVGAIGDPGAR